MVNFVPVTKTQNTDDIFERRFIVQGLRQSNAEMLDYLIEVYQHRLIRYLLFLTGNRETAEDLFQETWLRVLIHGAQYDGNASFEHWLLKIARNLVIDLSRKRRSISLEGMGDEDSDSRPFETATPDPSPFEQFESREDSAILGSVLSTLRPDYRKVIVLRFYGDQSLEEIANQLRFPLSTVKTQLYRGLAALKTKMTYMKKNGV